jgi:hypothetical protein
MNPEDAIKAEVRLFALESIVCQTVATLYQAMPREVVCEGGGLFLFWAALT